LTPLDFSRACWITSDDPKALSEFMKYRERQIAHDRDEKPVYLAESEWMLQAMIRDNPKIEFHFTSEFKTGGGSSDLARDAVSAR
jgi:peptide chain release factor 3